MSDLYKQKMLVYSFYKMIALDITRMELEILLYVMSLKTLVINSLIQGWTHIYIHAHTDHDTTNIKETICMASWCMLATLA